MTLLAVNGESVYGLEHGSQLLRAAIGAVKLTVHAKRSARGPALNPPAPTGNKRADAAAMETSAAIAFGLRLARDADLQRRCESKRIFKEEANRWKEEERAAGRVWKVTASKLLWRCSHLSGATAAQHKIPRVTRVVGEVVYFAKSGGLAAAAARVRESRESIEADKHGIQVDPLNLFGTDPVSRGAAVESELTMRNTGSRLCML
eukprot:2523039-Prymnesium_polylepis.1